MCLVVQLMNKFHVGVDFSVKWKKLWCFNFSSSRLVIRKNFSFVSKCHFHRLCISENLNSRSLNIAVFSPDRPNIVCAPVGGRVSVPCPNPSANEVKFSLFKDGKDIHHHMCNGKNTSNSHPSTTVGVEYKEAEKNSFNFTLTGVNASSHGIYQCEGTILFPPPLKPLPSTPGILLLIEGKYSSGIYYVLDIPANLMLHLCFCSRTPVQ